METTTTIIFAEDSKLYRRAIVNELSACRITTMAEASNGEELLQLLRKQKPDVVLLDLDMPVLDGNKTMQVLAANFPQVKVIILSGHYEITLAEHFIAMGARGYLPKDAVAGNIEVLKKAILRVKEAGYYYYEKQLS